MRRDQILEQIEPGIYAVECAADFPEYEFIEFDVSRLADIVGEEAPAALYRQRRREHFDALLRETLRDHSQPRERRFKAYRYLVRRAPIGMLFEAAARVAALAHGHLNEMLPGGLLHA